MGCIFDLLGFGASIAFDAAGKQIDMKKLLQGKSEDEKKVIKYFLATGCLSSKISDEEYVSMVKQKVKSLNTKQKALNKIGLDESQVNEIAPAFFEGYVYEKAYTKDTNNYGWISSKYQVAWLFFSSTQVYLYSYTFNMDDGSKTETTEEFFYKDITSFSTLSDSEESTVMTTGGCGKKPQAIKKTIETHKFYMVVPGDKFYCAMSGDSENETKIQAMKQKLREKKSQ